MEKTLLEFIDTLDALLKSSIEETEPGSGLNALTINQFRYIEAVHKLGTPTLTELADYLKISKASVTSGINKLVQMGYIDKIQSSRDKRAFHISLTGRSHLLIASKEQTIQKYVQVIAAALSESEARQFEGAMAKIVQLFQDKANLPGKGKGI